MDVRSLMLACQQAVNPTTTICQLSLLSNSQWLLGHRNGSNISAPLGLSSFGIGKVPASWQIRNRFQEESIGKEKYKRRIS